jgi:hypothetical protein
VESDWPLVTVKRIRRIIRALRELIEELTGLTGQVTIFAAAVYGFVHFFSK